MSTPFDALDSLLSGAVNSCFGELFRFDPFTVGSDVDAPKIADASRESFTAVAIWFDQSRSVTPSARGALQDDNAHNWTVAQPEILIDAVSLAWDLRVGDRVTRAESGNIYQISRPPRPDGMGHICVQLTMRKRAEPAYFPALDFSSPLNSQYIGQVV